MNKNYSSEELMRVRDTHEQWLMEQPGVEGVGIALGGDGRPLIKVFTNQLSEPKRSEILGRLGDVPVRLEETGKIRAN